jgi:F-type H+-transporting ATPase subunit delta
MFSNSRVKFERVILSEQASISKGIATRYASALFGLANEQDDVKTLEQDVGILKEFIAKSVDLNRLISSPIYSRGEQQSAITAIARKLDLNSTMTNTLALMAAKRRLFVVPFFLSVLNDLIADSKNEVSAEVVSATSLSKSQLDKLAKTLKANFGKDININSTVDENLIGGMIVKVGSRMIDTTILAKLNSLQNTMKEVG